jgi:hypothetical protein
MKNFIKTTLFIAITSISILGTLEIFSYYLVTKSKNTSPDHFRMNTPSAYKNSPYYSKRFIGESIKTSGIFFTPDKTNLVLARDIKANYINVKQGDRVTYPRTSGKNKIYIFGGSTVFSGEVPDYYTIPSLLAALISESGIYKYEVINKGVTSVNVKQQLDYLKTTKIKKGDIVVFYSGVNDILQGLYFGNPQGTIIGQQRTNFTVAQDNKLDKILQSSHIYKLLKDNLTENYLPSHLRDKLQIENLSKSVLDNYKSNIIMAYEFTNIHGGHFVNMLQPNLYSKSSKSNYEDWIDKNINFRGLGRAFEYGNAVLTRANLDLKKMNINSIDAGMMFDTLEEECYLDGYHTTEYCNFLAASGIYNILFQAQVKKPVRHYLNNIHQEYVGKNDKEFLYVADNFNKIPVELFDKFAPERFFGEFDKNALEKNILNKGFLGFLHKPLIFYQIFIDIDCSKNHNSAEILAHVNIGSKNEISEMGERTPLVCGKNVFNVKIDFNPIQSGLVIESLGEGLFIKSIAVYDLIQTTKSTNN